MTRGTRPSSVETDSGSASTSTQVQDGGTDNLISTMGAAPPYFAETHQVPIRYVYWQEFEQRRPSSNPSIL